MNQKLGLQAQAAQNNQDQKIHLLPEKLFLFRKIFINRANMSFVIIISDITGFFIFFKEHYFDKLFLSSFISKYDKLRTVNSTNYLFCTIGSFFK